LVVPSGSGTVTAVAGGGGVVFASSPRLDTRAILLVAHVSDPHTASNVGVVSLESHVWFGPVYGLAAGAGLGYASFSQNDSGGWSDSSFALTAYASPVFLRFGDSPQVEVGLTAGLIDFFTHDVRPWGYLSIGVVF
jgi:hypothetical protein